MLENVLASNTNLDIKVDKASSVNVCNCVDQLREPLLLCRFRDVRIIDPGQEVACKKLRVSSAVGCSHPDVPLRASSVTM